MDFSRPDNARQINRLKTLSAIRGGKDMSRAELSRELLINKVSISEIVDSLIKDGLIRESGKKMSESGRPATILEIDVRAGKVLSLIIKDKGCMIAASDLMGKILRMERFPRGNGAEEFKENLNSSLQRMLRNESVRIYGAVIVSDEDIPGLSDALPFPSLRVSQIEAAVRAERKQCLENFDDMLFIMLSERITAYFKPHVLNEFSHMRLTQGEKCYCGRSGCLESFLSGQAIRRQLFKMHAKEMSTREILSSAEARELIKGRLKHLSIAIALAAEVLGASNAMLLGEYSAMSDEDYTALNNMVLSLLPDWKKNFTVFKSTQADGGIAEGACEIALDHYFYKTRLLDSLKEIESL